MTVPSPSFEVNARCSTYDLHAGRCQLHDGHDGVHATDLGDRYATWLDDQPQHWRKYPIPHWIIDLAWIPHAQPTIIHEQQDRRTA